MVRRICKVRIYYNLFSSQSFNLSFNVYLRIDSNGDILLQKEFINKVMWTTKKFNILESSAPITVGADSYFLEGCPVLRAHELNDINNLIYIPNSKQPHKSMWIHFLSKAQTSFWKETIDAIIVN